MRWKVHAKVDKIYKSLQVVGIEVVVQQAARSYLIDRFERQSLVEMKKISVEFHHGFDRNPGLQARPAENYAWHARNC
jgi:hypothetical protein